MSEKHIGGWWVRSIKLDGFASVFGFFGLWCWIATSIGVVVAKWHSLTTRETNLTTTISHLENLKDVYNNCKTQYEGWVDTPDMKGMVGAESFLFDVAAPIHSAADRFISFKSQKLHGPCPTTVFDVTAVGELPLHPWWMEDFALWLGECLNILPVYARALVFYGIALYTICFFMGVLIWGAYSGRADTRSALFFKGPKIIFTSVPALLSGLAFLGTQLGTAFHCNFYTAQFVDYGRRLSCQATQILSDLSWFESVIHHPSPLKLFVPQKAVNNLVIEPGRDKVFCLLQEYTMQLLQVRQELCLFREQNTVLEELYLTAYCSLQEVTGLSSVSCQFILAVFTAVVFWSIFYFLKKLKQRLRERRIKVTVGGHF